jgi:hypothetical protein
MRRNILGFGAAIALCTATMTTGALAAHGRGSHWVRGHFHNGFGHNAFSRGLHRHRFAPSVDFWDWGGGWWAGYHYCGGRAYDYGYAPYSCYIYGGG